jgi:hypothetical protein
MAFVLASNSNNSGQASSVSVSSSSLMNQQQLSSSSPTTQSVQLTSDKILLIEMEKKNQVYYTPSKRANGTKRIVCDDDSYMLKLAVAKMAIIVSNDKLNVFLIFQMILN